MNYVYGKYWAVMIFDLLRWYFSAGRGHAGVALIPNLFGKPTAIIVGGGLLNDQMFEVVKAYPYVESSEV